MTRQHRFVALSALVLASTFGSSFLPTFNEGTFTVFLNAPPGTSLAESNRMAIGIETQLTKLPGVRAVVRPCAREHIAMHHHMHAHARGSV